MTPKRSIQARCPQGTQCWDTGRSSHRKACQWKPLGSRPGKQRIDFSGVSRQHAKLIVENIIRYFLDDCCDHPPSPFLFFFCASDFDLFYWFYCSPMPPTLSHETPTQILSLATVTFTSLLVSRHASFNDLVMTKCTCVTIPGHPLICMQQGKGLELPEGHAIVVSSGVAREFRCTYLIRWSENKAFALFFNMLSYLVWMMCSTIKVMCSCLGRFNAWSSWR